MKQGKQLPDMLRELQRQNECKKDYMVPAQMLNMQRDAQTIFTLDNASAPPLSMGMTDLFHRQLGSAMKIPADYYDRMQAEMPWLLSTNVNAWLATMDNRYMIRTMDYDDGRGQVARAFLSERYRRIDNLSIATALLSLFLGMRGCEVASCEITANRMYIKLTFTLKRYEVKPGDYVEFGILSTDPLTKEKFMELGQSILSYNEPAKTVPILAWAAGCFVKEHLRMKKIKYPLLFLIGEAGSGKSTTMENVLLPIFCVSRVLAASQMTRFTLMKMAASSNLVPLFLDEFKPSKMDKQRLNQLYNHFRDTYDGHQGERGSIDLAIHGFDLLAPMVVAGEEAADETAVRERSVELLFSKRDLKNPAYRESFMRITRMESQLGDFGRSLLQTALSTDPDAVAHWHDEMADRFDKGMPERVRTNLYGAYCGLKLLEALCGKLGVPWGEVFPFSLEQCAGYLEASAKEYLLDGSTHNKSVIDETFEIMSRMNLSPRDDYNLSADEKLL